MILKTKYNIKFKAILAGTNINSKNKNLSNLIYKYQLNNQIILLDEIEEANNF